MDEADVTDYRYTNTWFEDKAQPLWEKHLQPRWHQPINYLEVGVCEGQSMIWALNHLPVAKAVGVDVWRWQKRRQKEGMLKARDNAYHNLKQWTDSGQLQIVEEDSRTALPKLEPDSFDLVYIDAGHWAPEATLDMGNAMRLLKKGGMMVVDDLNRAWVMGKPQVLIAVHAFELIYTGRAVRDWKEGRQVAYIKR